MMFDRDMLNRLYRYSFALAGNESDAFDLLQSSIEKYLRAGAVPIKNEVAYIKKIIRNQYIDQYRKQNRVDIEQFDEAVTYVDMDTKPLEQIIASQLQVESVWQQLSSSEREIMYFWAVEGYTTSELAEFLEVPRGTLLSKIHRLRIRLEQVFGELSREEVV